MDSSSKYTSFGWNIIWASLFLTLLIWIATLSNYSFIFRDPFLFCSKISALIGTVGLCWTFLLSTRLRLFETLFFGLDKVYHTHRIVAIICFSLICLHPIFQLLRFIPDWRKGWDLYHLYKWGAVELGIVAFLLFITLLSLTLWIKIPYHIWKKSHEFFVFVLLLAFFHTMRIDKQVNESLLLSIWVYGFMALAFASYIYIRFLYWHVGPRYSYKIRNIEKKGKIWDIYFEASGKIMDYKPAQFIYISFENSKLGKELHPFSISSSPDQDLLRVSIKMLGDYTSHLNALQIGDQASIWGPYGRFYEKFLCETEKDAVLIAGGIGITPFASLLNHEAAHPAERKVYVFYCVKNQSRAYFQKEIENLAARHPSIIPIPWYSDIQGSMNVENLKKIIGELKGKNYFLCGPLSMMELFIKQLNQSGVKNHEIVFEDFNLLD